MFSVTVSGLIVILHLLGSSLQQDVQSKFSCQGRAAGYYADVDSGCQIYHMCDGLGRQFSYSCPNTTLFQQRMLICDHWYMVNCSRSETDYAANLLIGQNKPFVEDNEQHPYYRTPRPDLLSQPTASEYNIIYRKGKSRNITDLNLVGVVNSDNQNNGTVTDKPVYHLPSHWSTEYSKQYSTPSTISRRDEVLLESSTNSFNTPPPLTSPQIILQNRLNNQPPFREKIDPQSFSGTTVKNIQPAGKAINFNSNNLNVLRPSNIDSFAKKDISVNFKSVFKATTPVFPTKEELGTTESPLDDILNPPNSNRIESSVPNVNQNNLNQYDQNDVAVNFKSLFKATTPVFPTKEELGTTESPLDDILNPPNSNGEPPQSNLDKPPQLSLDNVVNSNEDAIVNFKSVFKATTPVFPTFEELGTTESPVDDILNPPKTDESPEISSKLQLPANKFVQFAPLVAQDVQVPSNEFLPPIVPDSVTDENKYKVDLKNPKNKSKIPTRQSNEKILKDLRKMFSIPDYEFPLDSVSRPGYDVTLDSFQVNPFLRDVQQRRHAFQ